MREKDGKISKYILIELAMTNTDLMKLKNYFDLWFMTKLYQAVISMCLKVRYSLFFSKITLKTYKRYIGLLSQENLLCVGIQFNYHYIYIYIHMFFLLKRAILSFHFIYMQQLKWCKQVLTILGTHTVHFDFGLNRLNNRKSIDSWLPIVTD